MPVLASSTSDNSSTSTSGSSSAGRSGGATRHLQVLFVEDSDDDRALLVMTLERAGFALRWRQVKAAEPLREALREPWDLVLCDYHLPGFGALAALEIVRASGIDLPFIIVSGLLGEEAAVAAMKAGAHDFFPKHKLARLGAAIERELGEAEVRKARRRAEEEERRLLAELKRALAVRDEFLVIASHELRTPITSLRLQADCLANLKPPIDRTRVARLDRQIDRLAQVVERLIDVTTLSSEPLRLVRAPTDLRAVVVDVAERSRDWIEQAGCTLTLAPLEEAVGHWDPVRLDTAVTNLLSNAAKFGADRPITVSVERRPTSAVLTVRDQGMGMTDDEQKVLFQKFGRAAPITSYGGFGLGLWIVDQIVRAHGGSTHVSSEKGAGATFTVELPLE